MSSRGRRCVALLGVAVLLAVAGCSSPKPKGHNGGTLFVLQPADFPHLDPGKATTAAEADVGRLLYRTLTSYAYSSKGGVHLVPDLATTTGTPTEGGSIWTFRLRPGMTYQDGTVITSQDVKHGVERSSAAGPIRSRLVAIDTPDSTTLAFRFSSPFVDFPYAAALPATAPVPLTVGDAAEYDTRIVSSGPYKIETYERDVSLTLVRNAEWNATSDPARKAFPDKVVTSFGLDPATIGERLISDQGQDQQAVSLSPVVAQNVEDLPKGARKRSHEGFDNGVSFLAFSTTNPVLADVRVRQALEWAYPHVDARSAEGGATAADIATGVIPPGLAGFAEQDLYKTPDQKGDPAATRQLLAEAGVHDLGLTYAAPTTPAGLATAAAVVSAYRLAGVTVTVDLDHEGPVTADLRPVVAQPPWPAASGYLPALFPCGSCDATLQGLLEQALTETDRDKADMLYQSLDRAILQQALVIPLSFTKRLSVHGSKVRNTTPSVGFDGLVDLANLSVR
jgi:peptide/nickel transport system substrate-binding protein